MKSDIERSATEQSIHRAFQEDSTANDVQRRTREQNKIQPAAQAQDKSGLPASAQYNTRAEAAYAPAAQGTQRPDKRRIIGSFPPASPPAAAPAPCWRILRIPFREQNPPQYRRPPARRRPCLRPAYAGFPCSNPGSPQTPQSAP